MTSGNIRERYLRLRESLPSEVRIVVAIKQRTVSEIAEVIEAGATDLGSNYVQEAEVLKAALGSLAGKVTWHMIGALQTNKVNKALRIFDEIQTIASSEQAAAIHQRMAVSGKKVLPVYIEVNAGNESSKAGVAPGFQELENLARKIGSMDRFSLKGLMTMGPASADPEECRPYFCRTRLCYEHLKALELPNADLSVLSMGMSDSYAVAIQEGANMVRIGTAIFGPRNPS